jgi:membrane-associated phospholipid phosphatase
MFQKITAFLLHRRLEDVMAAFFSTALITFFVSRPAYRLPLNDHDVVFIMLPAGILAVKSLLEILFNRSADREIGTGEYLISFFRPLMEIFRDWFPFFLLSACYYALFTDLITRVNSHTADAALAHLDSLLLGGHQISFLLEPFINPWLTDFLNLIYFSYVFALPGTALYFYLKKEKAIFRRIMMGYLTLMLMGIASYLLVPACGPEIFLASQFTRGLDGHMISRGVDYVIRVGRVSYDCFPSLHVAIQLLVSFYLFNYRRKLFIPAIIYVALMCLATLYLRYHYLTDVIAAFIYAPAAYWLNDFLLARWPGERIVAATMKATSNQKQGSIEC